MSHRTISCECLIRFFYPVPQSSCLDTIIPAVEEVKFGTPLNQKFGKFTVAKELGVEGGYKPGSQLSRELIAFSNMYWAKELAPSLGGIGKRVSVLTAEPVSFQQIKKPGVAFMGSLGSRGTRGDDSLQKGDALILANPGGEETWDKLYSLYGSPSAPMVVMNNAYSTTYGLGNKKGYEEGEIRMEDSNSLQSHRRKWWILKTQSFLTTIYPLFSAYYLKRISKGWIFRQFPGPWEAYLEKPDGTMEVLASYKEKPELNKVAALVRDESYSRYAINNDRWFSGRL